MVAYCGGTFTAGRRVEKIINERSGRMMRLPGECIVLDGVACRAHFSRRRLFCPRRFPYFREIWLEPLDRPGDRRSRTELRPVPGFHDRPNPQEDRGLPLVYASGSIASGAIGFLMIPFYTHFLVPTDYGLLELLDLTTFVIASVVGLGLAPAIIRFYYEQQTETQRHEVSAPRCCSASPWSRWCTSSCSSRAPSFRPRSSSRTGTARISGSRS